MPVGQPIRISTNRTLTFHCCDKVANLLKKFDRFGLVCLKLVSVLLRLTRVKILCKNVISYYFGYYL